MPNKHANNDTEFHIDTAFSNVRIERAVTHDSFDGSPWPPPGGGWCLVRTLDDWRHEWRRISLADERP